MENKKFIVILTSSQDRPEIAAGAMQLATNMVAFDMEVDFFLMDEAAHLAKPGFAETITGQKEGQFSPIHALQKTLIEDFDVKFYVCQACVNHSGIDKDNMVPNAEIKPGSFLAELLAERQALTF